MPPILLLEAQKSPTPPFTKQVFLNPRTLQSWASEASIRKTAWSSAFKPAELRYRGPCQTRHTYASIMLTAGEPPVWLAQQMGHSDLTMMSRIYGHWITDAAPKTDDFAVSMVIF